MPKNFRIGVGIGLLLMLSACGNTKNGSEPIARIEIFPQQINLVPGEPAQFTAVAKTASNKTVDNVAFVWQSLDPSIAAIDANGRVTGVSVGVATITASSGTYKGSARIGVVSPNPGPSNLTLSGTALYEDKPFDENGFTGAPVPTPARGAIINIVAIDGFTTIASGSTGQDGSFSFTGLNNASRRGGVYVELLSKTAPTNPIQVEIRGRPSDAAPHTVISPAFDDSAQNTFTGYNVIVTASSGFGGAFNILDVFSKAGEMIRQTVSCPPSISSPCDPPLLLAYWRVGGSDGTYYDDLADAIFVLGGGTTDGDTDEYDDSVIAHEYGHFALRHFSKDDSLGGKHLITENAQDIRLSWSEGWGNFFASAVQDSPVYVDTAQFTFSFELENLTSPQASLLKDKAIYNTSEIAVAGILWDMYDPTPGEAQDQLALGFALIWEAVLQIQSPIPATMESFWIQFNALNTNKNTFPNDLQAILAERRIKFFPDSYEGNEQTLLVGSAQTHTLYQNGPDPTGDEDIIPFNATANTSYTLKTLNLTNGADTYLTITDGNNGPVLAENDNASGDAYQNCGLSLLGVNTCPPNDATTLSSQIVWTAPSSGTFHAHVKRSPTAPLSSGRLGAYDISLTSP